MSDEIASIYVEACLDLRSLTKDLQDLQNKKYAINLGTNLTGIDKVESQLKSIRSQRITFTFDDRAIASELASIKNKLKIEPIKLELDTTSFDIQLKHLRTSIDPIKVDLAPDVTDFKKKVVKLARIAPVPITLDIDSTRVKNQFIEVGKFAAEGFNQGFSSVDNAGKSAINSLLRNVKTQLGVASPSKVFREIGKFAAEGFTDGLQDIDQNKLKDVVRKIETYFENSNLTIKTTLKPTDLEKSVSRSLKTGFNSAIRDLEKLNIFGFVAKLITTPIKAAFAGMNELLMLSLRPAFNALTNLFSGSGQDKSLFDSTKTTEEIKKTEKRYADLKSYFNSTYIVAKTDERALVGLNAHLTTKEKHLYKVIAAFNNNPIKPKFDGAFGRVKIAVDAGSITGDISKAVEKGVRQGSKPTVLGSAVGLVGKGLTTVASTVFGVSASLITLPLKAALSASNTIFQGAGSRIGEILSEGVGKGLATSLRASLGQSLGSGQIIGETLGEAITEGLGGVLKRKIPGIIKTIEQNAPIILGEQRVAAASTSFRANREQGQQLEIETGSKQAQKEFQKIQKINSPEREKQLKAELEKVLPKYQKDVQEFERDFKAKKTELTKTANKFKVSITPKTLIENKTKEYEQKLKPSEDMAKFLEGKGKTTEASKIRSGMKLIPKPETDESKISEVELKEAETKELNKLRSAYINKRLKQSLGSRREQIESLGGYVIPRQQELIAIQKSNLPARAKQLKAEISTVLPKYQEESKSFNAEYQSEKNRLTSLAKKFTVTFTPETLIKKKIEDYEQQLAQYEDIAKNLESKGRKGDASKIRSALSAIPKPSTDKTQIFQTELRQAEAIELSKQQQFYIQGNLKKQFGERQKALNSTKRYLQPRQAEYGQISTKLDNAAKNLDLLGSPRTQKEIEKTPVVRKQIQQPRQYTQVLEEVLKASGVTNLDPSRIPTLTASNNLDPATLGSYHPEKNKINLRPEALEQIKNGTASQDLIGVLVHELRHAIQFEFGNQTLNTIKKPGVELLKPDTQEINRFGSVIEGSTRTLPKEIQPIARKLEADAYTFQARNAPKIIQNIQRNSAIEKFEGALGIGGINSSTQLKSLQIEGIKRIHKIGEVAASFGIDIQEEMQHTLEALNSITASVNPILAKVGDLELLNPEDIHGLQSEIEEFVANAGLLMQSSGDTLREGLKAKIDAANTSVSTPAVSTELSSENEANLNRLRVRDIRKVAKQLNISTYNPETKTNKTKSELVASIVGNSDQNKLQNILPSVGKPDPVILESARQLVSLPVTELKRSIKFTTGQLTQSFRASSTDSQALKFVLDDIHKQEEIVTQALAQNLDVGARQPLEAMKLNLAKLKYKAKGELGKLNLSNTQGGAARSTVSVNATTGGNSFELASVTDDIEAALQAAKAKMAAFLSGNKPAPKPINLLNTKFAHEAHTLRLQEQQLKKWESQPVTTQLENSVNEQIVTESLAKEEARKEAQNNILRNPISFVKNRVYNSSVNKARYLTENAEGIANLVGVKVGDNPSPTQAKHLVGLQSAFGDLGDAATKFGQSKSPENFKALNIAIASVEKSLSALNLPFININRQIDHYTNKLKELQSEGTIDVGVDVESLAPEKFSFLDNVISKFHTLEATGVGALFGIAKGFLAFGAIQRILPMLSEFGQKSLATATNFESINRSLKFISGSSSQGDKNIAFFTKQAKDLVLDRASVLTGTTNFLAATQGTTLEGERSNNFLSNFNVLLRNRNVSKEQQQSALLAVEQIAGKGVVQSQELKLQLAQAVPGSLQIYARSQGLTVQQLQKKVEAGSLSSESLLQFGQQAYGENIAGIPGSLDTTQAATQRLDNSMIDLQDNVGKTLLPLDKFKSNAFATTLDVLSSHTQAFVTGLTFITLWMAKPVFNLFLQSAIEFSSKIGLATISTTLANLSFKNLGSTLKGLKGSLGGVATDFILFAGAAKIGEVAYKGFTDQSGEIGKKVDQQTNLIAEYKKNSGITKTNENRTPDWQLYAGRIATGNGIFGEDTARIVRDTVHKGKQDSTNAKFLLNVVNSGKLSPAISQVNIIDANLRANQTQQRALLQKTPYDTKNLRSLKLEEKGLINQRQTAVKPVAQIQAGVASQIETTKAFIDDIKTLKSNPNTTTRENANLDIKLVNAQSELSKLITTQDLLTKSVGKTARAYDILKKQILETTASIEDVKINIDLTTNTSKKSLFQNVIQGGLTQGNQQFLNSSLDIRTQQRQIGNQKSAINQSRALLGTDESQRVLKAFDVNESTGINKISYLAENAESTDDKFILQEFGKLQQNKLDLQKAQTQITESRSALAEQLRQQTKQVAEYYQGIIRQVIESQNTFKKQINSINSVNAQTALNNALIGTGDNIITQFVDSLIQNLQELEATKNKKIDLQTSIQQNAFQVEDAKKQGLELSRSLPGQFKGFDIDTINELNKGLDNTVGIVDLIKNGTEQVDSLLNENIETIKKLNSNFDETIGKTNDWKNSITSITNAISSLDGSFQGVGKTIASLSIQTASWIGQILSGQGLITTVATTAVNAFSGDKSQQPDFVKQVPGLQGGIDAIKTFFTGKGNFGGGTTKITASNKPLSLATNPDNEHHGGRAYYEKNFEGSNQRFRKDNGIERLVKDIVLSENGKQSGASIPSPVAGTLHLKEDPTGYGHYAEITNQMGQVVSRLGHMKGFAPDVKEGQQVIPGQVVGYQGSTGHSTGTHLHIELPAQLWGQFVTSLKTGSYTALQNTQGVVASSNTIDPRKANNAVNFASNQGNSVKHGGNDLTPQEYSKLTPQGKKLYELRSNKNILAIADAVARSEGTDFRGDSKNAGYGMIIGGENVNNLSGHPFVEGKLPYRHNSSASGRYQMMDFNYSKSRVEKQFGKGAQTDLEAVVNYGGKDTPGSFSPGMQDLYFIQSLKSRGVLDKVLNGETDENVLNKLAPHYASIQSGGRKSAYGGQGTPEGQHNNFLAFMKKRHELIAKNPAMSAYKQNTFLTPDQLQTQVSTATGLNIANIQQNQPGGVLDVAKQKADADNAKSLFERKLAASQRTFIRGDRERFDTQQQSVREGQDIITGLQINKSPTESFTVEVRNKIRGFDDKLKDKLRKLEDIDETINAAVKTLKVGASGTLKPDEQKLFDANKGLIEKTLTNTYSERDQLTSDVKGLRIGRSLDINAATQNFTTQEGFRQQGIGFEQRSSDTNIQQSMLETSKAIVALNTENYNTLVLAQPLEEKKIQLAQIDLETEKAIADIMQKQFKNEITPEQAATQIEQAKKLSIEKQKTLEYTNQLAQAQAKLNVLQHDAELNKTKTEFVTDSGFAKTQLEMDMRKLNDKNGFISDTPARDMGIAKETIRYKQELLDLEVKIQQQKIQGVNVSEQEIQTNKNNLEDVHKLNLEQIERQNKLTTLQTNADTNKTKTEFLNAPKYQREQLGIDLYKSRGGNEFVANASSRRLGAAQENDRYKQELMDFDTKQQQLKNQGINIDPEALKSVRADMEAIHGLNMDHLNDQFKTFGMSLNDIARGSIQNLGQGITGLIMGTKSLNQTLDEFFNNILSSVLNQTISSALGGLFGGGGGLFGGGSKQSSSDFGSTSVTDGLFGGGGGSIFGGLGNILGSLFYDGGRIPNYAFGGNLNDAFSRERSQSGKKPVLVVAHEGEMMIPAWRTNELASMGLGQKELLGYADGGVVGNMKSSAISRESKNSVDVKYQATVINSQSYVTSEQFEEGVRKAAQAGAEGGFSKVQSKLSDSSSFRRSVGL